MEKINHKIAPEDLGYLNSLIDKANEFDEKLDSALTTWVTHIITIETGTLAALIALKGSPSPNDPSHLLYGTALILIGLSMSLGLLFLHYLMSELKQKALFQKESLEERMTAAISKGSLTSSAPVLTQQIRVSPLKKVSKILFVLSSILALASILVYGIMIDAA